MLQVTEQNLGDVMVLRLSGRIVVGDECSVLRATVLGLVSDVRDSSEISTLVLDLAGVDSLDAAGMGVLLELRIAAAAKSVRLKLMNASSRVEKVLGMTGLDRVLSFVSVKDMFALLHRAAGVDLAMPESPVRASAGAA